MNTLAVLVPGPIGYHLFVRTPRDRLRRFSAIVAPADLQHTLWPLADSLIVVLVGTRHADEVADVVCHFADLLALPEPWLARVPRASLTQRATVAARIATAHARAPVMHYVSKTRMEQLSIPF